MTKTPLSDQIRVTIEDLTTGKKYGMVSNKTGDASEFGEVVRRKVLEIQGRTFISVTNPEEL